MYWLSAGPFSSAGGQRDPELQSLHAVAGKRLAVVPDAAAGAHPLDASGRQDAAFSGGCPRSAGCPAAEP